MNRYSLEAAPAVEADVEAAFDWYEGEEPGLGYEFLEELRAAYKRVLDHPFGYQDYSFRNSPRVNSPISLRGLLLGRRRDYRNRRGSQHYARPRRVAAPNLH